MFNLLSRSGLKEGSAQDQWEENFRELNRHLHPREEITVAEPFAPIQAEKLPISQEYTTPPYP